MHFWHHARDDNLVKSDAKKCQQWFYIQLREESPIKGWALMPMSNERWRSIPLIMRGCRGTLQVFKSSEQPGLPWRMWWKPLLGGGLFPWSSGTQPAPTKGSLNRIGNRLKVITFIPSLPHVWEFCLWLYVIKPALSYCIRSVRWRSCPMSEGHPRCCLAGLDYRTAAVQCRKPST